MSAVHILASYPKSGNTWIRLLLTTLLSETGDVDINNIEISGWNLRARSWFDDVTGLYSHALSADAVLDLIPSIYRSLAAEDQPWALVKTHTQFKKTPSGEWMLPSDIVSKSIYVVRDPRDVAISFAHHNARDVDWAIKTMADPLYGSRLSARRPGERLPLAIGTWNNNVESWIGASRDLLVVRYEDMSVEPIQNLRRMISHVGLVAGDDDIARAVETCRFDRLQEQEQRFGFVEANPQGARFFRKGRVGDWKETLTRDQADRIVATQRPMMARLGYL